MKLRKLISDKLKRAMEGSHALKSQPALERKSGVGQATIGRILRCEVDARVETLNQIAVALGEDLSYFLTPELNSNSNVAHAHQPRMTRKAPVISWVQAGSWVDCNDPLPLGVGDSWEDVPMNTSLNAFWLQVRGDSMTSPVGRSVPEGSLILVDPEVEADNGRLVIAKLTDSQEVTFKLLVLDGGRKYLKPLNPAYPLLEINSNCEIVGVVVESKQRL